MQLIYLQENGFVNASYRKEGHNTSNKIELAFAAIL